ncbi:MAG: PIN domain-containing protein [Proteobacteria bacterium]|nr:PIN domain-containing protein [Pseudomonadota bacterium]
MNFPEELGQIKTIFLDTAPIIYFIEAHEQFGPLAKQAFKLIDKYMIQAFTSVLTLSEVLSKPAETGNNELIEQFKIYLKNGPNLTMLPITETIGENAGILRGKYPHLKTVDAVQISTALYAEADVFLTNDKKLAGIKEIKILILSNYLNNARIQGS